MSRHLADFLGKAKKLEAALAARVEGASRRVAGSSPRQPLEIVLAVVDAVEQEFQPAGRGLRALPFNHIDVRFAAASPKTQARFELACEGPPSLQTRIADRLASDGCSEKAFTILVSFADDAQLDWSHQEFDITYSRVPAPAVLPPQLSRLELTIMRGVAERTVYVFDTTPIALGRGDEVRDDCQRLLRTNQVAFAEGADEVNQSVSRRHARIELDPPPNAYRLFDDGSAQGTSVMRHGRGFAVPRGTKGMRLQSGDEIVLGQARLRVKI